MMAMAVGELGLSLKSAATPVAAAAATAREKSSVQTGPSKASASAHFRTRISQKADHRSSNYFGRVLGFGVEAPNTSTSSFSIRASSAAAEKAKARYPGEKKGFVEEMRFVAMKLHTKDQSKEGEKEADVQPIGQWQPTIEGYLKFLVDSKEVYDTMETIVQKAAHPSYELFRNTGLERSERLAKDLEWFASQGHAIPKAGVDGTTYAKYLTELSETDVPAFICHFYNVYFAHSAGGKFIGKKVAEMILDGRELEFYKWDGELSQLLGAVKENLNKVAEEWTRDEKNNCLKETENSFKYSGKILRLIASPQ
ncbi:heme oxygenase 1, chloroplastic [Physcomitrium patens]|uniref:heme oxygenase (biliverdin-producing) n=5 Tax=Physcomitrium TaxID=37414 RepID=A9T3A8_PHYPA|nr:heme oxygenase 1, chloroplastic-like [Physcomitrium patens]PNR42577.1 hypothetical protein PHYPA_017407 [Physcomitrium patens]|eukprot:XP_024393106.1 heme oxygenase 1, chloroplastic-like [Physcomitrella patens]